MRQISDTELDVYLLGIISNSDSYNRPAFTSFSTLYDTGIRGTELFIPRWEYDSVNDRFILTTRKSQNKRTFTRSELPLLFQRAVQFNQAKFILNSYTAIEYNFKVARNGLKIFTAQKQLLSHSFRHNKAKKIYLVTQNYESVRQYFNLNSLEVATEYVTTPIFANF